MELPTLRFDKSVRPSGEGYKHGIRDHPAFCYVCTNFDFNAADALSFMSEGLEIDETFKSVARTSTMLELAEAADAGCGSCKVLRTIADNLGNGAFDPESDDEITLTYWEGTAMTFQLGDYTSSDHIFELFTLPGRPSLWPTIGNEVVAVDPSKRSWPVPGGSAFVIPQDPLSDACLLKVREWMAKCQKDHPYCDAGYSLPAGSQALQYTPKRLIDVGSPGTNVKLITTEGFALPYVALSYCWGNSAGLNLTKSNEAALLQGVSVSNLLQTHQDAIVITRNLGLQYLWTDGLCIRQDDIDEKIVEIANMDSVYSKAYLTIAATSARHANFGCLKERATTYKLPIIDEHGTAYEIFARRQIPHVAWDWNVSEALSSTTRNAFTAHSSIMANYGLFERGWCFQERLLSARILHFTTHEMVWECLGMTSCECGTMDDFVGSRMLRERRYAAGVPQDIEIKCGKLERGRKLAQRLGLLDYGKELGNFTPAMRSDDSLMHAILGPGYKSNSSTDRERTRRWRDLITQYSRRVLSFDSDALPAVAGLAKAWVTPYGSPPTYLAGMWQDDLHRSLLWQCIDENAKERPAQYLAPTWSWASVRRVIDWLQADDIGKQPIYHFTIQNVTTFPSTPNPYAQVQSGHITVTGPMMQATLTGLNGSGTTAAATAGKTSLPFTPDCVPEVRGMVGQDLYLLWWSTDINDARTGLGWERGLVLKRQGEASPADHFTRVGVIAHFPIDALEHALEERTVTIL